MSPAASRPVAERLESRTLLSVSVVKDQITAPLDHDLSDTTLVRVRGQVLFVAHDPATGNELWRTDGSAGGTVLVKDIVPGPTGSDPSGLIGNGSLAYFVTSDPSAGLRLWKSDGTAEGTVPVAPLGPAGDRVLAEQAAGKNVYYVVASPSTDAKPTLTLWRSDGTAAGTAALKKANPAGAIQNLTAVGDSIYFEVYNPGADDEVWRTNGTSAGTQLVKAFAVPTAATARPGQDRDLVTVAAPAFQQVVRVLGDVGGKLFFGTGGSAGGGLWTSDGTPAGTTQVVPLQAMNGDVAWDYIADFQGQAVFQFADRQGLFRSDGTAAGTKQIASLAPQQSTALVPAVTVGNAFYVASDNGSRLWRSDGTAGGTAPVGRFGPGSIAFATSVDGRLFFYAAAADQKSLQTGLYESDGTAEGTQLVRALSIVSPQGSLHDVIASGDFFFFRASDPQTGVELWRSDGTPAGTHILRNIDVSGDGFEFGQTVAVGSKAYFLTPLDSQSRAALWVSDGTDAGTLPIRAFTFPAGSAGSGLSDLIVKGNRLFFIAYDASQQQSTVWTSDGTSAGTVPVARPGNGQAVTLANLTAVGDGVYFELLTADGTDQLWRVTDISPVTGATTIGPGTRTAALVFDGSRFGDSGHVLANFTPVGTTLFFTLTHDAESDLWKVDTTTGDVSLVSTVSAANLAAFNGMLVFNGDDGTGEQLWESDGTFSGTIPVSDVLLRDSGIGPLILPVGNIFYFRGYRSDTGDQLWKSDGTPDGTMLVKEVSRGQDGPRDFTAIGSTIYFLAKNAAGDDGLWSSDGTPGGTTALVPDLGITSGEIAEFHGTPYFAAQLDSAKGTELYRTDGTASGPALVKDIYPGPGSSSPSQFVATDTTLFFNVADDGLRHGATYKLDDAPPGPSGRVFNDLNHDGIDDNNEPGLARWTVYLDLNGNGQLDPGEPTTTTDITGRYQFSFAAPAAVSVRDVVQPGYRPTGQSMTPTNGSTGGGLELGDAPAGSVLLDFGYLLNLAQHYGKAGTFATGDLNGDGKIDFADLLVLAQNYGHSLVDSIASHKAP